MERETKASPRCSSQPRLAEEEEHGLHDDSTEPDSLLVLRGLLKYRWKSSRAVRSESLCSNLASGFLINSSGGGVRWQGSGMVLAGWPHCFAEMTSRVHCPVCKQASAYGEWMQVMSSPHVRVLSHGMLLCNIQGSLHCRSSACIAVLPSSGALTDKTS